MSSFQGSFEKAGIVDVAIGLCATEAEHKQNTIRYFIFLNRYGAQYLHYTGKIDPKLSRMTLEREIDYDPDEDQGTKRQGHGGKTSKTTKELIEKAQTEKTQTSGF